MSDEVGREPQYEVFADQFLEHARDGIYNAYVDRPACLSLLGDVAGKRVLDAACDPGLYATELAAAETWNRGRQVHYWLTPLQATCEVIFQAGFLIERLIELRPLPEAAALEPERYERLAREPPGFMAFRLVPRPGVQPPVADVP